MCLLPFKIRVKVETEFNEKVQDLQSEIVSVIFLEQECFINVTQFFQETLESDLTILDTNFNGTFMDLSQDIVSAIF